MVGTEPRELGCEPRAKAMENTQGKKNKSVDQASWPRSLNDSMDFKVFSLFEFSKIMSSVHLECVTSVCLGCV